jgi:hypothetical protein
MEHLPDIFTALTPVLATISPFLGAACIAFANVFFKEKIKKEEIMEVLDKSEMKNEDLRSLAITEGFNWAFKEIQKLIKKK